MLIPNQMTRHALLRSSIIPASDALLPTPVTAQAAGPTPFIKPGIPFAAGCVEGQRQPVSSATSS